MRIISHHTALHHIDERVNLLNNFCTEGIPVVYTFSTVRKHYALVMELLGPSLADLLQACGGHLSTRTVAMIAKQLVRL